MRRCYVMLISLGLFLAGVPAHTLSLFTTQVTIGASTTRFTTTQTVCRQVTVQNNAAHDMHVGDVNTSSTRGIYLATASHGSATWGPFLPPTWVDLSSFYVNGTQNDVLDVVYVQ